MKSLRKAILGISVWVLLLAMPAAVYAGAGSKTNTGAVIPKYKNVITKTIDQANFNDSFRKLLREAKTAAGADTQYKIIIPPGTYRSLNQFVVPSNTCVYAKGAVINAGELRASSILTSDIDTASRNIVIDGGTWSTLKQRAAYKPDSAVLRLMGVRNVVLQNLTVKTNRRGHIVEVADLDGFTMTNCRLSGNNKDSGSAHPHNVQLKEAVQLDVATKSAMPNFSSNSAMYNGKGCHNVLITKNTFTGCARGVGSHSGTGGGAEKYPYTNITVRGNTMKNLLGEAVFAQDWRYCTIEKNSISVCRRTGIYLQDAFQVRVYKNNIKDVRQFTGARKDTYGACGVGILIRRSRTNYIGYNTVNKYYGAVVQQESICKNNTVKGNTGKNAVRK